MRGTIHFGGSSAGCVPHPGPSSWTQLELQRPSPLCSVSQSEKWSGEPLGAWRGSVASPAGPVTPLTGANAAGASLRPGEISV